MNSKVNKIQWTPSLFFAFVVQLLFTSGNQIGDNICSKQETYLVNVTEYYTRNITVRDYHWCYNVPPRCSYYVTKDVNDTIVVEKNQTRVVESCCPGYTQINDTCVPLCPTCHQGVCEDGTCVCFSGFKGPTCEVACETGEWGPNCSKKCDCNGELCDSINGCIKGAAFEENNASQTIRSDGFESVSPITHSNEGASDPVESYSEVPELYIGPNMQPRRELLREIIEDHTESIGDKEALAANKIDTENHPVEAPVGIMFGDQVQQESSQMTTDRTTEGTRTLLPFLGRQVVPYNHNYEIGSWNTYLKLYVPIFAMVVLIALILAIYYVSKLGERKSAKKSLRAAGATSIIDGPLPDPPSDEQTIHLASSEYRTTKIIGAPTFETRLVCNGKKVPDGLIPGGCHQETIYDHPRSTKSSAAASQTKHSEIATTSSEPIYDEVLFENPFLYIH